MVRGGIITLPFLDPKDERTRTALFAICIVLIWRYVLWRFTATLPAFALRFDSLYAWGFSCRQPTPPDGSPELRFRDNAAAMD